MHSPPLWTSLGWSSSSRRLAAGSDHDFQLLRTVLAACSCLSASDGGENGHCGSSSHWQKVSSMTSPVTSSSWSSTSLPPEANSWVQRLLPPYLQATAARGHGPLEGRDGADRWNAVCTVTMAYIMQQRPTHEICCTVAAVPTWDK